MLVPIDRKRDIWMDDGVTSKQDLLYRIPAPLKERGTLYGDPLDNLSCTNHLWIAFTDGWRRSKKGNIPVDITLEEEAHHIAMQLALLKVARIATGKFCEDNYIDAIGYLEIARKLAKGEDTSPEKIE